MSIYGIKAEVRNKIHWQDSNLELTAWASNSGEEKYSLDYSATGHYIKSKDLQTILLCKQTSRSHGKNSVEI